MYAHKLDYPFTQEMYDVGLVVLMSRSYLVETVNTAARSLAPHLRDALVDSVNDDAVKFVAVGAYNQRRVPDCKCPATLAGFGVSSNPSGAFHAAIAHELLEPSISSHDPQIDPFPLRFDCAIWLECGNEVRVIEVM